MSAVSRKHPELAAKVANFIESGLDPDQIIEKFREADHLKALEAVEGSHEEKIPDEIQLISQALAYRDAVLSDFDIIYSLIKSAYSPEIKGSESFRTGEVVSEELLRCLLEDCSYRWLIMEAPSGRGIEEDGLMLGVSCFSTDGISKRNGDVEGNLCSIRLFAVLPRYHGLCLGRRLLSKTEEIAFQAKCCRVMACIPSKRSSMVSWIERRNYVKVGSCNYPFNGLNQESLVAEESTKLFQFVKLNPSFEVKESTVNANNGEHQVKNKLEEMDDVD